MTVKGVLDFQQIPDFSLPVEFHVEVEKRVTERLSKKLRRQKGCGKRESKDAAKLMMYYYKNTVVPQKAVVTDEGMNVSFKKGGVIDDDDGSITRLEDNAIEMILTMIKEECIKLAGERNIGWDDFKKVDKQ
jgi:hypothetical protein